MDEAALKRSAKSELTARLAAHPAAEAAPAARANAEAFRRWVTAFWYKQGHTALLVQHGQVPSVMAGMRGACVCRRLEFVAPLRQ
jgi:hypothetical protein